MIEKDFKGIYPVLSLPFTEKKEIDYGSLSNLVNFCNEKGAHGIVIFGVASEFYKITDEESREVIRVIVEKNEKKIPLIVGVGKLSTETTIMQAKFCNDLDVDGLMIFPPYFIPTTTQRLFEHYLNIAKSVDMPIIIQDAPQVSGVNMDIDFFINISKKAKNIRYVKIEAPFAGPKISMVLSATKGGLKIFDGNGGIHFYEHLIRGVCGLMPGCSLLEIFINIYNKFSENKVEAFKQYEELLPLLNIQSQAAEVYIACEKLMLKHRGIIRSSGSREPWINIDKTMQDLLFEILQKLINC